jgi:hypothetical protein
VLLRIQARSCLFSQYYALRYEVPIGLHAVPGDPCGVADVIVRPAALNPTIRGRVSLQTAPGLVTRKSAAFLTEGAWFYRFPARVTWFKEPSARLSTGSVSWPSISFE